VGEDAIRDARQDAGVTAMTVAVAAEHLGITKEAVRKRISRGTLRSDKDADGTVRVYIPAYSTMRDAAETQSDTTALISAKDETISTLRDQLEAERQGHAEARRLLMAALERIPPQLEAPESPESPSPAHTPTKPPAEPQEGVQRPWWRRIFR